MVAVVPDDCFQKGLRPLTQIAHPAPPTRPPPRHPCRSTLALNSPSSSPGLSWVGPDFWSLFPLPTHVPVCLPCHPRGRIRLHFFSFPDVNGWESRVRVKSCFVSTSVPGELVGQEPRFHSLRQLTVYLSHYVLSSLFSPGPSERSGWELEGSLDPSLLQAPGPAAWSRASAHIREKMLLEAASSHLIGPRRKVGASLPFLWAS